MHTFAKINRKVQTFIQMWNIAAWHLRHPQISLAEKQLYLIRGNKLQTNNKNYYNSKKILGPWLVHLP